MMLLLVRHGEAEVGDDDAARALTRAGKKEALGTARVAAAMGVDVRRILHSGRRRAQQTAEIWAETFGVKRKLVEYPELDFTVDPLVAAQFVAASAESMVLVGHLPHLSSLASLLVIGEPADDLLVLPTGAVVALEKVSSAWRIRWLLTPKLARAITDA